MSVLVARNLEPTKHVCFASEVRVLTGRDGMRNEAVFPVSRFGQRIGSRASTPSVASCAHMRNFLVPAKDAPSVYK